MIPFRRVPGLPASAPRPLLDVFLDETLTAPQTCLLDTGAAGIRLSAELARALGVALPAEPNGRDVIVGNVRSQVHIIAAHPLTVELDGAPVRWTAPVSFCDPWPHPFGLLGLAGFFDAFDVLLQARDARFELAPRR